MTAPVFIGDEVTAAGYRLAGARIHTPPLDEITETLLQARRQAPLILITAEYAARVPAAILNEVLAARRPPLTLVPDVRGAMPLPDLAERIRTQLGIGG